jgi:hypothetical protein
MLILFHQLWKVFEVFWALCYKSAFLKSLHMILESIFLAETKYPIIKIILRNSRKWIVDPTQISEPEDDPNNTACIAHLALIF